YEIEADKNPEDYICLHHLAGVYVLKGDYDRAKVLYLQTIKLEPSYADSHLNLGVIHAYLDETDDAVRELKDYVRLDLHSPRVERVLRAISKLKGVPYEDVVQETVVKSGSLVKKKKNVPEIGTLSKKLSYLYKTTEIPKVRKIRIWGPIDTFLLLLTLIVIAAWYFFPSGSRAILGSAISNLENQYAFTVESGDIVATESTNPGDLTGIVNNQSAEDSEPVIVNANPSTSSYLPLAIGNRWEYVIYDTRDPSGNGSHQNETVLEMTVRGIVNSENGIYEVRNGDITVYFMESTDGLYNVINPDRPLSGKIIQVPYPPDTNRTVSMEGQTVTVIGEEVVETPAGFFNTIKLKYELRDPDGQEWYIWYAQGVGIVKYIGMVGRMGMYHVRELSEFELN
ncbi:MAG: tetratricopeptide repeat protein, partial [bacterium]|nr:tetratricopeptide repeat protein [bacterium]